MAPQQGTVPKERMPPAGIASQEHFVEMVLFRPYGYRY